MRILLVTVMIGLITSVSCNRSNVRSNSSTNRVVSQDTMERIFDEIKTPYKFGIVLKHPDSTKLIDSPTIFRENETWYMTYIVFDGQGYETWIAESENLLD